MSSLFERLPTAIPERAEFPDKNRFIPDTLHFLRVANFRCAQTRFPSLLLNTVFLGPNDRVQFIFNIADLVY